MPEGFFTALGTPIDIKGKLVMESFIKHIEEQIQSGAAGLLAMGSMGIQPMLNATEFRKVAKIASEAAHGVLPVYVGVMMLEKDRISLYNDLKKWLRQGNQLKVESGI